MMPYGIPKMLSLRVRGILYNVEEANIDIGRLEEEIRRYGGRLIILGPSFIPFINPIREICRLAREYGLYFVYDGSHVLGLIAGRAYPNPLKEGADAVVGSTHKTFPGPQGGLIATSKNVMDNFKRNIVMRIVDNPHYNRIAALAISMAEMIEYGETYASQVVRNARRLAKALYEFGVPVLYSEKKFTETHQVILGIKDGYNLLVRRLEKANIIVDYGKRLGTCEITRLGFVENEMDKIAELIYRVYNGEKTEGIKKEVVELVSGRKVEYTFD